MFAGDLFEMSNIRKNESGLPVNIFVSSGGSVNKRHGPRIKVMTNSGDRFDVRETVSIILKRDITENDIIGYSTLGPEVIPKLRAYINLNYDVLMDYWNDEISTSQMISGLRAI